MAPASRVRQWGLLALVLLLAGTRDASAQHRITCATIHTDETVPSVAARVTGDARNMEASWFQIVNPTTARRVPKTRYGLTFAGWKACVVDRPILKAVPPPAIEPVALALPSPPLLVATASHPVVAPTDPLGVWVPAAAWGALVLTFALTYWVVDERLSTRAQRLLAMKRYAERFVEEFERPLVQPRLSHRPIESRVRFRPGRLRFDVLLAPQGELRYPNLTDHKRNVMYDVVRIQQALSEHAFVSSRPYARGRWVVVPFRFRVGSTPGPADSTRDERGR